MNKYPDGKLGNDDEGILKIAVYNENGRMVINFGKNVSWIGFDKKGFRDFVTKLNNKLEEYEQTDDSKRV